MMVRGYGSMVVKLSLTRFLDPCTGIMAAGNAACLVASVCIFYAISAYASPEQDTRDGMEAFRSGDTVGAMQLYRKAAEQGYAPGMAKLAEILDRSEMNEEALSWYEKAVSQNNAEAQYGMGIMYLSGDGVEMDVERGLDLINAAADQKLESAMFSLFHMNKDGAHGMPANLEKARDWLLKLANNGNQWAIGLLSNAYRTGELGLPVNEQEAISWESKLVDKFP